MRHQAGGRLRCESGTTVLLVLNKPVRHVTISEEDIHIAAQIGPTELMAASNRELEEAGE